MILHGDCLDLMAEMEPNSVDAIVTDPPAGIAFMNKSWDSDKGGRDAWIDWLASVMCEAYRVAKPGAHAVVWALPRTSGWTHRALEDAGWEIRDCITHLFGSGFPKSHNLPDGRGTALKPAAEFWYLARKPLAGTVAANVLAYGTGAINVDACRIEHTPGSEGVWGAKSRNPGTSKYGGNVYFASKTETDSQRNPLGRWPANVILDETAASLLDAMSGERKSGSGNKNIRNRDDRNAYGKGLGAGYGMGAGGDTGGASRFFLVAQSGTENPDSSDGFMVQYDCNCETTEGGEWAKQDQRASIQAASDTPPKRDTTASTSGTVNEAARLWPTSLNGNSTTDLSPTVSRSTTATETSKTTASRTCNCSIPSPTSAFTQVANSVTANGGSPAVYAASSSPLPLITGTSAARDGRSTDDAALAISEKSLLINSGDVTRFAYVPKASRAERSAGLSTPSNHPTVKPLSLMRWLVRLVTPPGGVILDPFAGSGSTGCAAALEGFDFIGIEREAEYVDIARARIAHWTPKPAPQLALTLEAIAGD